MSIQIKKKFLRSNSVDGSKVLFLNEDSFNALKSDGSEEISLFKLDSDNKFQLLQMPRVSLDPSHNNELTRKSYVDAGDAAEAAARAAADAAEAAARAAADAAEAAAREDEDTAIRAEFAAADALNLLETKNYVDEKVSVEAAARLAEDAEIREEFAAADLLEKTQREAADQLLRDDLDSEISTRASEDVRVLSESKAYTDVEKARAMAAEAAEAALRASEDARVLSESKAYTDLEKARAMAAEEELASDLDLEVSAREAADESLYEDIQEEAALRASEDVRVLSESKTYTDSKITQILDGAPEAYDTLREIAEYISSDQTATTSILTQLYDHETRLDIIEGSGEGSIAKAEADAKAYTDQEVLAEKSRAMLVEEELRSDLDEEIAFRASEDARVLSESKAYTDVEKARAMAAEAAEAALRASEDVRVLSEAKAYTDVEKARAMAEESDIRSDFAAADASIISDLEDLEGYALDIRSDLDEEIAFRASEDVRVLSESKTYTDVEKARAMAAEAAEAALRASEDARVLSESKTYTDQKVAAVINGAPALLDTLKELAEAINNDENFAVSVTNYIAAAKSQAQEYASSLVDSLGERFVVSSSIVTEQMISDGYIELSYKAFSSSIVFSIDRLMLLENEDYTVSVVNGKTRLTFTGSILPNAEEALASGDILNVRYLKDVRS